MEKHEEQNTLQEPPTLDDGKHIEFLCEDRRQVNSQDVYNRYNVRPPTYKGSNCSKAFVHSRQVPNHPFVFKDRHKPPTEPAEKEPSDEKEAPAQSSFISHGDFRYHKILLHWK